MDLNTIQLVSIAISGVIGLGGVIVAGLSAYWSRLERVEPLKQRLYEEQLTGATESIDALVQLQTVVDLHHREIGYVDYFEDDEQRQAFIAATDDPAMQLKLVLYRWSHVLPYEVFAPMAHYLSIVEYASEKRDLFDGWAGAGYPYGVPWQFLARYFLEAIAAARDFLGVEPLSSKLSATIGATDEERKKEIQAKTLALGYLMSNDYRPYQAYHDGYQVAPSISRPDQESDAAG